MKTRLIVLCCTFLAMRSLSGQETGFWQKVNAFLTKPAAVDTSCVYQPAAVFWLGLNTTGQKAGFDVDVNFDMSIVGDESVTGLTRYRLSENLCKKIGLEVGYGNVSLGYALEVGPRSAETKRAFGLNIFGKSWGVRVNLFKITNPFTTSLIMGEEGDADYFIDETTTEEPAVLRSLSVDGCYVFNNKRFAYPAAYKVGMVQRRTAGSWMVAARYMQGDLYNTPEAAWDSYNLLDCFATMQASLGGGYSVNFVAWHRDPTADREKGLRNITINLTAMPMLTLFNYLKTTSYEYDDNGKYTGEVVTKVLCYPVPNYIGSAAVGFTFNRWFFTAQFTYNRFYFRSRDAFNSSIVNTYEYLDDLGFRGIFHDWMLKGMLVYRF